MHLLPFPSMRTSTFLHQLTSTFLAVALSMVCISCSGGGANGDDPLEPPASPTGLEASSQDGSIALDWDAMSESDTYRVYRSTSSGVSVSSSPLDSGISSPEYVDESAENGTTYYYVVTAAVTEGGESAESGSSNEVEKTPFSDPPDRP